MHHMLELNDIGYYVINPKFFDTNSADYPLDRGYFLRLNEERFITGLGGHSIRPYRLTNQMVKFSFTILRDPITRYISHFKHQRDRMRIVTDVEEFLSRAEMANFMVKALSKEGNLDEAKEVLGMMAFYGIVEELDSTLKLMSDFFGKQMSLKKTKMVGKSSERNLEIYYDQIIQNNLLDIELYKFALENFENQVVNETARRLFAPPSVLRKPLRFFKNRMF